MPAVGGPVESVSLSGRVFAVAADADAQRELGGSTNTIEPNGDSSARLIKGKKPWMIGGLTLSLDDDRGDQEYIQELANRNDYFVVAATFASGHTYQGSGQIVEDISAAMISATLPVTLSGGGVLTQQ